MQVKAFFLHPVHKLVAIAFVTAEVVALEAQAPEMGDKFADRMHGIARAPGVDDLGLCTVAEGQDRFVARSCEVTESNWPAGNVCG